MKLIFIVGEDDQHFLGKLGAETGTHSDIEIATFGMNGPALLLSIEKLAD